MFKRQIPAQSPDAKKLRKTHLSVSTVIYCSKFIRSHSNCIARLVCVCAVKLKVFHDTFIRMVSQVQRNVTCFRRTLNGITTSLDCTTHMLEKCGVVIPWIAYNAFLNAFNFSCFHLYQWCGSQRCSSTENMCTLYVI